MQSHVLGCWTWGRGEGGRGGGGNNGEGDGEKETRVMMQDRENKAWREDIKNGGKRERMERKVREWRKKGERR